jgi:CTP synthase (UTP-ammonia lyase)
MASAVFHMANQSRQPLDLGRSPIPIKIAIIGEYDPSFEPHALTDAAIGHSARHLDVELSRSWVSTSDLTASTLDEYDGAWIAPGSPYRDMGRTLRAIQYARLNNMPCLGTCGGFQHMVIEFARNQLGIADAEHAEYDPYASRLIVSKLECSLAGREMKLSFAKDSLVAKIYGSTTATERYYCNFGVNPNYARQISAAGFRIVGSDSEGEARVMELSGHPYFVGTLFVPQFRSTADCSHPLVTELLRAAVAKAKGGSGQGEHR